MNVRVEIQIKGVIDATNPRNQYLALLAAIDALQNPGTLEFKLVTNQYLRSAKLENIKGRDRISVTVPGNEPATNHQIGQDSSKHFSS